MPQCPQSRLGTHNYAPCPKVLNRAVCVHCGQGKMCTKSKCVAKYLKLRWSVVTTGKLQSLVVPLDSKSGGELRAALRSCGVRSVVRPNGEHDRSSSEDDPLYVTLLEGLLPPSSLPPDDNDDEDAPSPSLSPRHEALLESVRSVLSESSSHAIVVVRRLHKVRQSELPGGGGCEGENSNVSAATDANADLILADVTISPALRSALSDAHERRRRKGKDEETTTKPESLCVLPQYPARIELGTVVRKRRRSVDVLNAVRGLLQGRKFVVDGSHVKLVNGWEEQSTVAELRGGPKWRHREATHAHGEERRRYVLEELSRQGPQGNSGRHQAYNVGKGEIYLPGVNALNNRRGYANYESRGTYSGYFPSPEGVPPPEFHHYEEQTHHQPSVMQHHQRHHNPLQNRNPYEPYSNTLLYSNQTSDSVHLATSYSSQFCEFSTCNNPASSSYSQGGSSNEYSGRIGSPMGSPDWPSTCSGGNGRQQQWQQHSPPGEQIYQPQAQHRCQHRQHQQEQKKQGQERDEGSAQHPSQQQKQRQQQQQQQQQLQQAVKEDDLGIDLAFLDIVDAENSDGGNNSDVTAGADPIVDSPSFSSASSSSWTASTPTKSPPSSLPSSSPPLSSILSTLNFSSFVDGSGSGTGSEGCQHRAGQLGY